MQIQINSLCLIAAAAIALQGILHTRWWSRHFSQPRQLRTVVVTVALAMLSVNLLAYGWTDPSFDIAAVGATLLLAFGVGVFAANRRILPTPAARPRRVLAVGAHPDDLELACGGTIAKFIDSGHEVHALVMSEGQRGGDADIRPGEALTGGAFMGVRSCHVLKFPDTALSSAAGEMVSAIERSINRINPDIILTHSSNDQHQDHYAVHLATLRAGRQHSSILCYESPSATRAFDPSVFVEITDYVDIKVEAVGLHRNQAGKAYMTPERVRSMAAFRGAQARGHYAEAFEPVRLLEWNDETR